MLNSVGTPWLWGSFALIILIMLAIDLLLQGRRGAQAMTMRQRRLVAGLGQPGAAVQRRSLALSE